MGIGVPTGGTTNQYLIKLSNADYDFGWGTPAAGIAWPLLAPNGAFNAPSYSFQNSQTTGIFRDGSDAIGFSTNGLSRWTINASGHLVTPADNNYDIGAAGATRPRTIYAATSFIGPGAVPTGGGNAQVLTKSSASDYALSWTTPFSQATADTRYVALGGSTMTGLLTLSADPSTNLQAATKQYADTKMTQAQADARYQTPAQAAALYLPLAGGTLTGNLLFSTDNTRDIGASGATRPRDFFLGRNLNVGGTGQFSGHVGINNPPDGTYWLWVQGDSVFGGKIGINTIPGGGDSLQVNGPASLHELNVGYTGLCASRAANIALLVGNLGLTGTTQYGISINPAPTGGTTNIGLYNGGTSQLQGNVGVGAVSDPTVALWINQAGLTGVNQVGLYSTSIFTSACTGNGSALAVQVKSVASSFTMAQGMGLQVTPPNLGAGSVVTGMFGIFIANQGASGVTNAYGLRIQSQSGASTNNIGVYLEQNSSALLIGGSGTLPGNSAGAGIAFYAATGAKISLYDAGGGNFYGMGVNPAEFFLCTSAGSSFFFRTNNASGAALMTIASNGRVTASEMLVATGGPCQGNGAYINSASSQAIKKNVIALDPPACLDQVLDLRMRPIGFEYVDPSTTLEGERLGFIIEEVAQVIPEATVGAGLSVEALVPVLWGAVRELSSRLQALENAA
jgi:hypothetical protein